jgi:hypothetical protein
MTKVVPYGTTSFLPCIRSLSQLAAVYRYPPKIRVVLSVHMCALFQSESCDITLYVRTRVRKRVRYTVLVRLVHMYKYNIISNVPCVCRFKNGSALDHRRSLKVHGGSRAIIAGPPSVRNSRPSGKVLHSTRRLRRVVVECGGGDNVRQEVGGTGRCKPKGKKWGKERERLTHTLCAG